MIELESFDDEYIERLFNNGSYYGVAEMFSYRDGNFRTVTEAWKAPHKLIEGALEDLETGALCLVHASGGLKPIEDATKRLGYEQCDILFAAQGAEFGDHEAFKTNFYVHKGAMTMYQPFGEVYVSKGYFCKVEELDWKIKAQENSVILKFIEKPTYGDLSFNPAKKGVLDGYF